MTDQELLTLCCFQEAVGEPDEGVAAVARVVLNRTKLLYASSGTIASTILRHDQFSWTTWTMVNRTYEEVAKDLQAELVRVQTLLSADEAQSTQWARCGRLAAAVQTGSFTGPLYAQLTDHTVLYDNLALARPLWAATSRHIVKIGHHDFFEPLNAPTQPAAANDTPQVTQLAAGQF